MKAKSRRRQPSDRRYPHLPHSASLGVLAAAGLLSHGAAVLAAAPAPGVRIPTFAVPTGPATVNGVAQVPLGAVGGRPIYAPQQVYGSASYSLGTDKGRLVGTLTQTGDTGIVQWSSFDIGRDTTVNIVQPSTTSILLNRITGGWYGAGLQTIIEGMLNSNGQVYILNPNGIVFGKTSQVNVNSLVASTLNIDNTRFLNGLTAASQSPFFAETSASSGITVEGEVDAKGKVIQAQITAADGGKILLVAPTVTNNGKITAPNGQVILAAGRAVYVSNSDNINMRGVWVEVNNSDKSLGDLALPAAADGQTRAATSTAENGQIGQISVGTGNATLVGYAVNQRGIVSATTSVNFNGSIWLHARDGATMDTVTQAHALENLGGKLELYAGSVTQVAVDTTDTTTTKADLAFIPSAIELTGNTIHLAGGSLVQAKGGNIKVTAAKAQSTSVGDGSRVLLDAGAVIDASGTTSRLPMASNILPVYLGSNELQDSPLLRDSALIHGQTISVDIRKGTPLLSASAWQAQLDGAPLTIGQRTAAGGTVSIKAGGDVVLQKGSTVDVSGGVVNFDSGYAPTSQLTYLGRAIDVSSATPDKPYDSVIDARAAARNYQVGYGQGYSAGSVSVDAPAMVLRGSLLGHTTPGAYQRTVGSAGTVSTSGNVISPGYPKGGLLQLGADSGSPDGLQSIIDVVADLGGKSTAGIDLSAFQIDSALPDALKHTLDIDTDALAADGINRLHVNTNGQNRASIRVSAPVRFAPGGELRLMSSGGVDIDASISLPGGTVTAASVGTTRVADNVSIDVAGLWTSDHANAQPVLDAFGRPTATIVTAGGSISLGGTQSDGQSVVIGNGDSFDVSGGAWLSAAGALSAGSGGSIHIDTSGSAGSSILSLGNGVAFRGYGVSKGGTLEMTAPGFVLGGPAAGNYLSLAGDWFQQGGFSKYDLRAAGNLRVAANAKIAPRMDTWQQRSRYLTTPSGSMASAFGITTLPLAGALGSRGAASLSLSTLNVNNAADTGKLTVEKGATIATDPGATVWLTGHDQLTVDGTITAPGGAIKLAEGNGSAASVWLGSTALLDVSGTAARLWQDASGLTRGSLLDGGSIQIGSFDGSSGALSGGTTNVVVNEGARLLANGTSAVMTTANGSLRARKQAVASAGGTISIDATTALLFAGSASAAGGNASAAGGTLNLMLDAVGSGSGHDFVIGATAPAGGIVPAGLAPGQAIVPTCGGHACVLAGTLDNGGFDWINIKSQDSLAFDVAGGKLALAARGGLTIDTPTLKALNPSSDSVVTLSASYVKLGNAYWQYQNKAATASAGVAPAELDVTATTLDLVGNSSLVNFGRARFDVAGDVRLVGVVGSTNVATAPAANALPKLYATGSFTIAGSMAFNSAQLYTTSLSEFTLAATGTDSQITFNRNAASASAQVPLSAAGTLKVTADTIDQNGVVRAPLGRIEMTAGKKLIYRSGSLTSVAGSMTVPLGFVENGRSWLYDFGNGNTIDLGDPTATNYRSLPDKSIVSTAPDVEVQAGAVLDMSGGGDFYAYQFTAGPGGSKDVLASSTVFAILPGYTGAVAPQDFQYGQSTGFKVGDQVYLSGIAGLPAGYYTLLPAHYALLSGGFAVTLAPGTSGMVASKNYQKLDGSWVVAGYRSYAGGGADNLWSGFVVTPGSLVRKQSEFDEYSGSAFLAASGAMLPADGGHVAFDVSTLLQLDGLIKLAAGAGGAKGIADISAPEIAIVSDRSQDMPSEVSETAVKLAVGDLMALDADSLLIGGVRSPETGGDRIKVGANELVVANNDQHALTGPEVILAANDKLTLTETSSVKAQGTLSRTPRTLLITDRYNPTQGADGALVRVSTGPAVAVQRNYTFDDGTVSAPARVQGTLDVKNGAILAATGSMLLDATYSTNIAAPLNVGAGTALALGANTVSFGSDAPAAVGGLRFDDAAIAALGHLKSLALTSYGTFDVYGGVDLGALSMDSLSFSGGGMRAMGTSVGRSSFSAQTIRFDRAGTDAAAPTLIAGSSVTFKATDIEIGNGAFGLHGFDQATLAASNEIRAVGKGGALSADNDLRMEAARITARSGDLATFTAGRNLDVAPGGRGVVGTLPALGLGGSLAFVAKTINSTANIIAQAGNVSMTSTASADEVAQAKQVDDSKGTINIDDGTISAAGGSVVFSSTAVAYAPGGSITLDGGAGDVVVKPTATLDVSAVGAAAGTLTVRATAGKAVLNGQLKGSAIAGIDGVKPAQGKFVMDVGHFDPAMTFGFLNGKLNVGGFTESRNFRLRNGDIVLDKNDLITSHEVVASADNGNIDIYGTINADGAKGGSIELYAAEATAGLGSGNVIIEDGAWLHANANIPATAAAGSTGDGGSIVIGTGTADGSAPSKTGGDASIDIRKGATLSVWAALGNGRRLGQGGTVLLRAPRLANGTDVAIAGINGAILGSRSTAVEAYKVYSYGGDVTLTGANGVTDGSTRVQVADANGAPIGTAFADAGTFVSSYYGADRLNLAGKSIDLQPGVEVRAGGNLTVSVNEDLAANKMQNRGWDLSQWRFNGQPIILTLRAGRNLTTNSISDGFTKSATASMPDWKLSSGTKSASYRLVAGADKTAANPMATVPGVGDMMLMFARTSGTATDLPVALIRTGTGNIDIAAGRDVVLDTLDLTSPDGVVSLIANNRDSDTGIVTLDPSTYSTDTLLGATIYTAGSATTTPSGFTVPTNQSNSAYGSSASTAATFSTGGGAIDISAGRNVQGSITDQLITNWLFRQGAANADGSFVSVNKVQQNTAWWSRFDYFDEGVATFGGGDIRVTAQGNVSDLAASVATNAYIAGSNSLTGTLTQNGGGDLTVRAGGDIRGGTFYVQEGSATIRAGGAVTTGDLPYTLDDGSTVVLAPVLAVGNADFHVTAGSDLTIGGIFNPMLVPQSSNNNPAPVQFKINPSQFSTFSTYGPNSAVNLVSVAGDTNLALNTFALRSVAGSDSNGYINCAYGSCLDDAGTGDVPYSSFYTLLPGTLKVAALSGDIKPQGDGFSLWPNATGQLDLLAHGSITVPGSGFGTVVMMDRAPATLPTARSPIAVDPSMINAMNGSTSGLLDHAASGLHTNDSAAHIIALTGDINFTAASGNEALILPKKAEIAAGRDIVDLGYYIQHLNAADVTTVTAGRDVIDTTDPSSGNDVVHDVAGPGRLDITAGRNFDLGNGVGVLTGGNLDNPNLPKQGAAVDIVAGARPDYARFVQQYGSATMLTAVDQTWLVQTVKDATGQEMTVDAALAYVNALPESQRQPVLQYLLHSQSRPLLDALYYQELRMTSGATGGTLDLAAFDAVIASLFPAGSISGGDINVFGSQIKTQRGGAITLYAPGGSVYAGLTSMPKYLSTKKPSELGVFTIGGGAIQVLAADQLLVNQGRVFSIDGGDITMVSQYGDIHAGKGSKTALSAPPPVLVTDAKGNTSVDITNSIVGSGIATLKTSPTSADANVYAIAPRGVFNAGDAGVRSSGKVNLVAAVVLNASNISASGGVSGAATATTTTTVPSGPPPQPQLTDPTAAGNTPDPALANNLTVELLGYGGPDSQEPVTQSGHTAGSPDADTDDKRKTKSR